MAKVTALFIKEDKDLTRSSIDKGYFKENHGLVGDCYSGKGPRQVCMLRQCDRDEVNKDNRKGLCFPRFGETLRIECLPLEALDTGMEIKIGEAILRVSKVKKKCYPECEIFQSGEQCLLVKGARYLEVIQSGEVVVGDEVTHLEDS